MVIMVNVEGFKPYVDKSLLGHLIFVWTPKLLENKALNPGMCLQIAFYICTYFFMPFIFSLFSFLLYSLFPLCFFSCLS